MKQTTLQFLGCGDAFGSGGRMQTCFYVESEKVRFLIDCGVSSQVAMKRFGVATESIDAVIISHLHGDHFGGLPFFLLESAYVCKRTRPLYIASPPGLRSRLRNVMSSFFWKTSIDDMPFPVLFIEYKDRKEIRVGEHLRLSAFPVVHSPDAKPHGVKITCGDKIIAYSGDSEWTETLPLIAEDADVFICEMFAYETPVKHHMVYSQYLANRDKFTCKRFIMTHMGEEMLSKLGEVDTESAEDGKKIVL